MAVKYLESGIVHEGYKGGFTGCGFDTSDNPNDWQNTSASITCDKDGCKN
ncbi:MAG: hypothetical protein JXR05_12455 [Flavobacteriaceae bacterium]